MAKGKNRKTPAKPRSKAASVLARQVYTLEIDREHLEFLYILLREGKVQSGRMKQLQGDTQIQIEGMLGTTQEVSSEASGE